MNDRETEDLNKCVLEQRQINRRFQKHMLQAAIEFLKKENPETDIQLSSVNLDCYIETEQGLCSFIYKEDYTGVPGIVENESG